uniref:A-kinase anchoring protein 1 n=1 Tax=Xenopus tropicalis TaxID=8364 RepID=A0A803JK43_XENTR
MRFPCRPLLKMALRMRLIFPYAVSGVLALIGCWWLFSRKKDQRSKKHKSITAPSDKVQVDDEQKEFVLTQDIVSCLREQPVHLNRTDTPNASSLASEELGNFLIECSSLETIESEPMTENIVECSLNEIVDPSECYTTGNTKATKGTAGSVEDLCICSSDSTQTLLSLPIGTNVAVPHDDTSWSSEETSNILSPGEFVCESKLDTGSLKIAAVNEEIVSLHEQTTPTHLDALSCITEKIDKPTEDKPLHVAPVTNESEEQVILLPGQECSGLVELITTEVCSHPLDFPEITLTDDSNVQSTDNESVEADIEEVEAVVQMSVSVPFSLSTNEGQIILGSVSGTQEFQQQNDSLPDTNSIELVKVIGGGTLEQKRMEALEQDKENKRNTHGGDSEPVVLKETEPQVLDLLPTTCIETVSASTLREDKCAAVISAYSHCLEKAEKFVASGDVVADSLKGNAKQIFGDYDTKMVEQLAINIISKVIVAAKQEILSGKVSDILENSCQEQDTGIGESLLLETQSSEESQQVIQEQNGLACGLQSDSFTVNDLACESLQTEQKDAENINSCSVDIQDICPEQQSEEVEYIEKDLAHRTKKEPDFSPVHKVVDSFDEVHEIIDDSNISSCTSEDGICIEEPLQSTVLSGVGVGSYDSLSTSGIETTQEQLSMSSDQVKKSSPVETKNLPYSNGDLKRMSPDLKSDGQWIPDIEVDHSGGSDVNSMDSVDSGCALKTEQLQNVKRADAKKAELVIWEIEVPKHLVGRLIGKQGRFVSFLKESSGAKIYISTLPYTQDFQICHIEGSRQQIDRALVLIGKKFKELNLTNIYAPPPCLALHSFPMTSWLMLPDGVTVEVIVVNVVNAGHMFVQQHTHPTFHALRSLDQQMYLCYSQPGIPTLPTPVEAGVICAAPAEDNAWWRAQVVAYFKDEEEVEIRYVDYGGYERVKVDTLRQIRSDFVTLPFQGAEVLLDNVIPLAEEDHFSTEADEAATEMTRGTALLAQVTNYDGPTGLPLIQLWSMMADEVVSVNRTLVERGFAQWMDSF